MAPTVKLYYALVMEATNIDEYTFEGIDESNIPDLDDMSYLDPELRTAWEREVEEDRMQAEEEAARAEADSF